MPAEDVRAFLDRKGSCNGYIFCLKEKADPLESFLSYERYLLFLCGIICFEVVSKSLQGAGGILCLTGLTE